MISRHTGLVLAWVLLIGGLAEGRGQTWDGGAGTGNWGDGLNWNPNGVPAPGAALTFAGIVQPTIDTQANRTTGAIAFSAGADLFTINNNTITLGGNITNNSINLQTINSAITLSGNRSASAALGSLLFGGNIALSNSATVRTLTFTGANNTTVNGIISNGAAATGNVAKTLAGTLTLNGANTFSGPLTLTTGTLVVGDNSAAGTGTLSLGTATLQAGGGPRTLGNVVTLAGNTTFSGGNALTLSGAATLTGNRTLTNTVDVNFSGAIGQNAAGRTLTKAGAGTMTLTGANTYSGATTIAVGTLQIGDGGTTGSLTGAVVNNAALIFNRSDSFTYGGGISGTGSLTKTGAGVLSLTGANTYSGGTAINGGTVAVSSDANLGGAAGGLSFNGGILRTDAALSLARAVTLNAGGGTVDDNGNNTTLSGVMSGTGSLTKTGAGILTLTGTNTYSGGTTVAAGTVSGNTTSLQGAITNNALVDFNQAADGTYAGVMSGTGSLTKTGAGILTLSGANTYTGNTDINAGTLSVNGTVGPVSVGAAGTLQGTGTVGPTTVNGTIAPGNSIGTLTVNGNYTQAAGSTYTVEANAAAQSDLLNVAGTATLLGGTVNVLAEPGAYNPATAYTILNAAGGVTGTFAGVTDTLDFLDATLQHNPTTVVLNLARNDLTFGPPPPAEPTPTPQPFVVQTPNQSAVGTNLDILESNAQGDLRTVFNTLTLGTIAQARVALDDLSGEVHGSWLGLGLNAHQMFLDSVRRQSARARVPSADSNSLTYALAALNGASGAPVTSNGVWLQALGIGHGRFDGDGNAGATDYTATGVALGGDTLLHPHLRVGGAFAYSFSDANVDARNSSADSNGYHATVYSSYHQPGGTPSARGGLSGAILDAAVSYARFETDTSRRIRLGGLNRKTQADYSANLFSVLTEGRYGLMLGRVPLQPYLGVRYQWLSRDGFTETGADSVNLVVAGEDQHSFRLGAGFRLGQNFSTTRGWLVRPEVRVGWEHEFLDDHGELTARLAGAAAGAPSFTVQGVNIARDRALFNAGLTVQVNRQFQLYADYTGWANSDEQVHGGIGGVRVSW